MTTLAAHLSNSANLPSESGRIWVSSESARELLKSNGLTSLKAVLACGEPLTGARSGFGNRHPSRGVDRAQLHGPIAAQVVYIKKQWHRERWLPRLNELRDGTAFVSTPVREWCGLLRLREAGLDTAEPLGLFADHRLSSRAAIVTGSVPGKADLEEMATDGQLEQMTAEDRASLMEAVVDTIRQIRAAGYGWRSLKPKHMFPHRESSGRWRIWLIDCDSVHRRQAPRYLQRERQQFVDLLRAYQAPPDFCETISRQLSLPAG